MESQGDSKARHDGDSEAHADSPRGLLARLSVGAIRFGESLELEDAGELASALYGFHRISSSSRLGEEAGSDGSDLRSITLRPRDLTAWRNRTPRGHGSREDWLVCSPREAGESRALPASPTFKLYVSPQPAATRETFEALLEILPKARGLELLKVAASVNELSRPDKIVAYFSSFESLFLIGQRLVEDLPDVPVQGVPFTAELGGEGLLSWAMDPPRGWGESPGSVATSWRSWITERLAHALISAARYPGRRQPAWRSALHQVEALGVDVSRWVASPSLWERQAAPPC